MPTANAKEKAAAAREKVDLKALDFNIDPANPQHVAPIAAAAWENVRGNDDATFATSSGEFQHKLIAHVGSALKSGPAAGDTYWARAEQEAVKLRAEKAELDKKADKSK